MMGVSVLINHAMAGEHLKVELEPPTGGVIRNVKLHLDKRRLLVSGAVHRHRVDSSGHMSHIDITLLNEQGETIALKTETVRFTTGAPSRPSSYHKTFANSFPYELVKNAKVLKISYHTNLHIYHSTK